MSRRRSGAIAAVLATLTVVAALATASATAAPLRSLPEEAAVAEVFGTLSVRVDMTRTWPAPTPRLSAVI